VAFQRQDKKYDYWWITAAWKLTAFIEKEGDKPCFVNKEKH